MTCLSKYYTRHTVILHAPEHLHPFQLLFLESYAISIQASCLITLAANMIPVSNKVGGVKYAFDTGHIRPKQWRRFISRLQIEGRTGSLYSAVLLAVDLFLALRMDFLEFISI